METLRVTVAGDDKGEDVAESGPAPQSLRKSFRAILREHGLPYLVRVVAGDPVELRRVRRPGGEWADELAPASPDTRLRALDLLARFGVGLKQPERKASLTVRHVVVALPAVDSPPSSIGDAIMASAGGAGPLLIGSARAEAPSAQLRAELDELDDDSPA
jgi:transposase InsO family protein